VTNEDAEDTAGSLADGEALLAIAAEGVPGLAVPVARSTEDDGARGTVLLLWVINDLYSGPEAV
jgi:hypothetical protein